MVGDRRHVRPTREWGCWALLAAFLLGGIASSPAGAGGLDVLWQWSKPSTRGAFVAFSPDGQTVAAGAEDVTLWRVSDGQLLGTLEHHLDRSRGEGVAAVSFSPDGQYLASGDGHGTARLWRVSDGQLLRKMGGIQVAFSPDGQILAVMDKNDVVRLRRVSDGAVVRTLNAGPGGFFPYLAVSPDGQSLATATADTRLWQTSDVQLIRTLPPHRSWAVAFSPDGQLLVSTAENTVFLWGVADGSLLHALTGHRWWVDSAAFTRDGKILVTGSNDVHTAGRSHGEINFWAVESGELLRSEDPGAGVASVALSADGSLLAYGLRTDSAVVVARNPYAAGQ